MKKISLYLVLVAMIILSACSKSTGNAAVNKTNVDFPTKPIEIIVPYDAGGGTDMAARALASKVSEYLPNKQAVVVVNKPGGGGTVGNTQVLHAKPDGYTLLMTSTGALSIQPNYGKATYSHDSFAPIMRVLSNPQAIIVKADAPWKTYDEWLAYMKKNPGEFTYGTAGTGLTGHIAMEALSMDEKIKARHVPFDGAGPALTALLGGHVQGVVVQAQNPRALVESGEVRPLINIGSNKEEGFDGFPWVSEKASLDVYHGLLAPKDTPKEVLDILHDAFKKALEDPAVIDQINKGGAHPAYAGPEDFQKEITESYEKSRDVLQKVGLIK